MAWVRAVCGRLKSDYRYSKDVVYNNYPWPTPTDTQRQEVEQCAQAVLDARASYAGATLGQMYSNLFIFPKLHQAHQALDKAVDAAYRTAPFTSDSQRMEFLFDLYIKYNATIFDSKKKQR